MVWYQGTKKNSKKTILLTCSYTSPFQVIVNWWLRPGGLDSDWIPLLKRIVTWGFPDPNPKPPGPKPPIYHLLKHGLRWPSNQVTESWPLAAAAWSAVTPPLVLMFEENALKERTVGILTKYSSELQNCCSTKFTQLLQCISLKTFWGNSLYATSLSLLPQLSPVSLDQVFIVSASNICMDSSCAVSLET